MSSFEAEMAIRELASIKERIDRQRSEQQRETADAMKGFEDKRRRGEYGPEWKTLQQRIDMRQTTEFDIRTGMDHSPEARKVREYLARNIATNELEVGKQVQSGEGAIAEAYSQLEGQISETQQLLREIQDQVSNRGR